MKAAHFCLLLALGAVFGSGCAVQKDETEMASASACQVLDYGIEEFKLISSLPIVSENYEFLVSLEQVGDCKADSLTVSLYEGSEISSQYKISNPQEKETVNISWVPDKDSKITVRAELEIMDQDIANNSELLQIDVLPIGNYLYISDLTGDYIQPEKFIAEAIHLRTNITAGNLELFLRSENTDNAVGAVLFELREDENGKPGGLITSKNIELALTPEYNWYTLSIDQSLNPGKYWLVLGSLGDQKFLWHYSRREAGGALMQTKKPEFLANDTTLIHENGNWSQLPQKDFTFKLHTH